MMIKELVCLFLLNCSHKLHVSELGVNHFEDVVELLANLVFRGRGRNQLHVGDLVHDAALLAEGLLDEAHGDLLLLLAAVEDDTDAALVEADDDTHHAERLVQRAVVVVLRERVLLQEFILDDLGGLRKIITNLFNMARWPSSELRNAFDRWFRFGATQ